MAVTKIAAADVVVSINTGTEGVPVWTQIKGLESPVEHSPSTTRADTFDQDSNGREEHVVVRRGDQFTLKGFRLQDEANGDRDPGQEAVETLAQAKGLASLGQFQIKAPGETTGIVFKASAQVKLYGGGSNDMVPWEAELAVSGDITWA